MYDWCGQWGVACTNHKKIVKAPIVSPRLEARQRSFPGMVKFNLYVLPNPLILC